MWLKFEGFTDSVKGQQESYHFQGTPSFILVNKLKALKLDLKKWNLEEFGNVAQKINSLLDSITTLDAIEESRPLFGN